MSSILQEAGGVSAGGRSNAVKPHALELREKAYKMFTQRMPLAKIGEALEVPADTVRKWSSKGKWKARMLASGGTSAQPRVGAETPATNDDIDAQLAKLIALPFAEKQQAYLDIMANESLRAALSITKVPHAALVQNADKVKKLDEVARRALKIEDNKPTVVVNVGLLSQPQAIAAHILPAATRPQLAHGASEEKVVVSDEKLAAVS